MNTFLLDTSAVLTLFEDQPGAETIAAMFEARDKGEAEILISHMTVFELTYLTTAAFGAEAASSLVVTLRSLSLSEVWPDDALLWQAGQLKALGGLSVADAFIAASAMRTEAVLVHKDQEYDRLSGLLEMLSVTAAG